MLRCHAVAQLCKAICIIWYNIDMSINYGFSNEVEIKQALDGHKFSELNPNLQKFITEAFAPSEAEKQTEIIHAQRMGESHDKPDLVVKYLGKTVNVSIKIGKGNSVHQEPVRGFVKYLREELKATPQQIGALLLFHWGDGTLDGSAPVERRMPAREVVKKYPKSVATMQELFDKNVDVLLERFLSTGIYNGPRVDYIYYGSATKGGWRKMEEVYAYLKQKKNGAPSVGGLNYQTYGRSLQGRDDKRRQSIQLKWPEMASYFLQGE